MCGSSSLRAERDCIAAPLIADSAPIDTDRLSDGAGLCAVPIAPLLGARCEEWPERVRYDRAIAR
jgi:hypothetical protein